MFFFFKLEPFRFRAAEPAVVSAADCVKRRSPMLAQFSYHVSLACILLQKDVAILLAICLGVHSCCYEMLWIKRNPFKFTERFSPNFKSMAPTWDDRQMKVSTAYTRFLSSYHSDDFSSSFFNFPLIMPTASIWIIFSYSSLFRDQWRMSTSGVILLTKSLWRDSLQEFVQVHD